MREKISIMTSTDENLVAYIFVQLKSISLFFQDREVDFYLFSTKVPEERVEALKKYAMFLGNVKLYQVDVGKYEKDLERFSQYGGNWPVEAYFPLVAHELLPEDVHRILYIDAGDVIFWGDNRNIDDYYHCDFGDSLLYATPISLKEVETGVAYYQSKDLVHSALLDRVVRGLFNSGSYMINLKGFRGQGINLQGVIHRLEERKKDAGKCDISYFGDQGFLSLVFVDELKFTENVNSAEDVNLWYMPYNFCIWFFDMGLEMYGKLWYEPYILHFAGGVKPWKLDSLKSSKIKKGQLPFYGRWKYLQRIVGEELAGLGLV